MESIPRDHEREHEDLADRGRKYHYEFDTVVRRFMMRAFELHLPAEGRALELGCFEGDCTELLAERFPDLTVIEAAADLIERTCQRMERLGRHVEFIHGTFETVAPSGRFDAAFMIHTLEHVDDPVAVLARIAMWLSEEGKLFIAVPNANAASRRIAVKMGLIPHHQAVTETERRQGHRRTYALDTFEHDIRAAGLRIRQSGGVMFKALANFQFDRALADGTVTQEYLEGCYLLGCEFPDLCASIFAVCEPS